MLVTETENRHLCVYDVSSVLVMMAMTVLTTSSRPVTTSHMPSKSILRLLVSFILFI